MAGGITERYTTETLLNPTTCMVWDQSLGKFAAFDGDLSVTGLQVTVQANIPTSTDSTMSYFRATGLFASAQTVKNSAGNLYGFSAINNGVTVSYVKTYEMPAANVNPGTTASTEIFAVPAMGVFYQNPTETPLRYYSGLSVLATSTLSDLGTQVAPTGTVFFQCSYK